MRHILLEGRLYITNNDVCFTAYLPRTQGKTLLSGTLSKMGKRAHFSRNWFVLKQDQLSYYNSAKELYFPVGAIDLRYAFQAEVIAENQKDKIHSSTFALVTEQRTYRFRADSAVSAQQWVKSLQRAIFLSRNEGDQVKIKIPVENILDLEETNLNEFGVALKIRAIDSENTFSIDEYCLAFLHPSQKSEVPLKAIRKVMDQKGLKDIDPETAADKLYEELASSRRTLGKVTDSTHSSSSPSTPPPDITITRSPASGITPDESSGRGVTRLGRSVTRRVKNIVTRDESHSRSSSPNPTRMSTSRGPIFRTYKDDEVHSELSNSQDSFLDVTVDGYEHSRSRSPSKEREGHLTLPMNQPASTTSLLPSFHFTRNHGPTTVSETASLADKKKKVRGTTFHKVSDMLTSSIKHFQSSPSYYGEFDDLDKYQVTEDERIESNARYQDHFTLGEDEELIAAYYSHIQKPIPIYGKIYISANYICFRSLLIGTKTKMVLPFKDVENVSSEHGFKFGYSGLVFIIHGHEEVFFEFSSRTARDDCESVARKRLDTLRMEGSISSSLTREDLSVTPEERLRMARLHTYERKLQNEQCDLISGVETAAVFDARNLPDMNVEKPYKSLHITMVTIGSRGDVQPYIALSKGLMKEGHKCRIATHVEFKDWVEGYGIEFKEVAGDPGELMKIMIEHGMFSVSFLRDAAAKFRGWIDELLHTSWVACQGTDLIIESPSAMGGLHIAEALKVPYFRAFTMPWTRTRTYPHAFLVPDQKMGGSYNHLTYVLFENVFWKGTSSQINKWRVKELGIGKTNLDLMNQSEVPFMYNVSPSVLVPPVDYSDWITVTGYWFLDEGAGESFKPPEDLANFIAKARKDNKKLIYIGFGSIVVSNPAEMTKAVVESVLKAGVRCILSKGWSERFGEKDKDKVEVALPSDIFQIKSAPHDWLFPQMDAAVHHGGSGTTGASLRAGLPTIIKPFFGDQFFYSGRVEDLGVGLCLKKLTVNQFSKAITEVTTNKKIINKAKLIGAKIRKENGVDTAIATLYWQMDYAQNIIKKREQMKKEQGIVSGLLSPVGGALHRTFSSATGSGPSHHRTQSDSNAGVKSGSSLKHVMSLTSVSSLTNRDSSRSRSPTAREGSMSSAIAGSNLSNRNSTSGTNLFQKVKSGGGTLLGKVVPGSHGSHCSTSSSSEDTQKTDDSWMFVEDEGESSN